MWLLLLVFGLIRLVYCIEWDSIVIQSEWSSGSSNDIHKSVLLTAVPSKLCLHDHLTLDWTLSVTETKYEDLKVIIQAPGIDEGVSVALGQLYAFPVVDKIQCQDGNVFCQPKTKSVNVLLDEGKVHMIFDRDAAVLSDAVSDPFTAFEVVPSPHHTPIVIWINSSTVDIHLDSTDMEAIASAHAKGELLKFDIKPFTTTDLDSFLNGQKTFRPTQTGTLDLYIVNSSSNHRVSAIQSVFVEDCTQSDNIALLPRPTRSKNTAKSSIPRYSGKSVKQFTIEGIFPVTGVDAIKVTHTTAPAMVGHFYLTLHSFHHSSSENFAVTIG